MIDMIFFVANIYMSSLKYVLSNAYKFPCDVIFIKIGKQIKIKQ